MISNCASLAALKALAGALAVPVLIQNQVRRESRKPQKDTKKDRRVTRSHAERGNEARKLRPEKTRMRPSAIDRQNSPPTLGDLWRNLDENTSISGGRI
jgi:hypothetical protein